MRIHITADMEGIATLAHDDQVEAKGYDYGRMREIMTGEVQSAIEGARDAGADSFVVCDAHDVGRSILAEKIDKDVELIQGSPYELGMMSGISADFDASFQIGYHSMRDTPSGTLGHTYTFHIAELRLNGLRLGESGLSAAIAGHFGVPAALVSGDSHAVKQARRLIKNLVGVPTKEGVGLYGVRSLTPMKAQEQIRKGAKEAIENLGRIKPFVVEKPVRMDVRFTRVLMAEHVANIPLVRRRAADSVSYKARDVVEAFKVFQLMNWVAAYAKDQGPL
jgi:D-amino peptidase